MLLVIISLMMATILTASYLASRDNSATIGANVASSTDARATALSGLDIARAILQTQSEWRTNAVNGELVTDLGIGSGKVTIGMTDVMTDHYPTAASENVELTVISSVNGVQEVALAEAFVPTSADPTVDVDLSEFAVYAADQLTMSGQSTITRWTTSPLAKLGRRIAIGTQADGSSSLLLSDSAAAIDTTVFAGPAASSSLASVANGPNISLTKLADKITMPASPASNLAATSSPAATDATFSGGSTLVTTTSRHRRLEIKAGAVRTLKGNLTLTCEEDLRIGSGAKLVIEGNVKAAVYGNLSIDDGSIELKGSSSSLTMYIRGSGSGTCVEIRDGFIGELRSTSVRDNSGNADWMNPQRISLFSVPPTGSPSEWLIRGNSVVKASVYCPDAASMTIEGQSAIYGRLASRTVTMADDAALFYDHSLDRRRGYTNPQSWLYDTDGRIKSAYLNLASLDASLLQSVALSTDAIVLGVTFNQVNYQPSASIDPGETPGAEDPTPRPVPIEFSIVAFASDVHDWEAANP
jgi:hypothetical protein